MPDLSIDFTWFKDPKGYRLSPAKPAALRRGQSILDTPAHDIQPARIVRNGGKLQAYRPFEVSRKLFKIFIDAAKSGENGVLDFVKRFGPLTYVGLKGKGDIVLDVIKAADDMLDVRSGRVFGTFLGKLNVAVIAEPHGVRLKVEPPDLLSALWLQVAQAKDVGAPRECLQCNRPFIGLRADAKFCSNECRIKFNSLKRSQ